MSTRTELLETFCSLDNEAVKQLTRQKNQHNLTRIRNSIVTTKDMPQPSSQYPWLIAYRDSPTTDNAHNEKLKQLYYKLMGIGGQNVLFPSIEEDIDNILEYGQLWDNITTKRMKGRCCQCHRNACDLWYANKDKDSFRITICTGYALSDDGLWRQHSWLIQVKARANVLIETTEPRLAYFGFAMTFDQSEQFDNDNL